jgi:hypothetical protein
MLRDFASGEGLSDRRECPRGARLGRDGIEVQLPACRVSFTFIGDIPDALWEADSFSRLSSGWHSWQQSNDPWHPAEDGTGGQWTQAPWDGVPLFQTLRNAHNVDLGACSVFIPWKWDDRDPRLDPMIGPMLGDRGLAEFTLDELDAARADSSRHDRNGRHLLVLRRVHQLMAARHELNALTGKFRLCGFAALRAVNNYVWTPLLKELIL